MSTNKTDGNLTKYHEPYMRFYSGIIGLELEMEFNYLERRQFDNKPDSRGFSISRENFITTT